MKAVLNNSSFTQAHFQSLFESIPELYLVLSPDLYIVAVTDAYAQATSARREDLLNKSFFEVFPDNPDDTSAIGMSTDPEHADKRNKHVTRIKDSVRNLTGILEDFLSLDKLEQGKTEIMPERVNLRQFGELVKEQVEGMLKERQSVLFSCTGNPVITVDKKILRNVLFNLLSNAIKYSPEEKTISLRFEVNDKTVRIGVKDEGIGIPEEEQKNMFQTFFSCQECRTDTGHRPWTYHREALHRIAWRYYFIYQRCKPRNHFYYRISK